MYAVDIPLIASFDGNDIAITQNMIFSDRVVYHEEIDMDEVINPGQPLEDFVNSFVVTWGSALGVSIASTPLAIAYA